MKKHPNYEKIKNSAQWRGSCRELRIIAILIGAACGLGFVLQLPGLMGDPDFFLEGLGIAAVTVLGLALVLGAIFGVSHYVHWRKLTAAISHYRFCTVKLEEPHQGWKNCVYFTVNLTDKHGKSVKRNTESIFTNMVCPLEQYLNKTVEVAWNEKTDKVVVIGIVK